MSKADFLTRMLSDGKITQEQCDAAVAKQAERDAAKEKYKKDKTKLTKPELQALLDTLTV